MTTHNYLRGREARGALMQGVIAVRDAVAPTLGQKGKDAVLEALEQPHSIVTNDGISIAERIKCSDPVENMGANLIKEAISRANTQSGDGSTTTCVLTAAILEEGQAYAESTEDVKQSLFDCLPLVLASIDAQTKPITPEDVHKVATISAQNEEMGTMVGEIFKQIGKDGVIDWDNSYSTEDFFEFKDGVELKNVAPVAQWMMNHNAKGEVQNPYEADRALFKKPHILITQEKISSIDQIEPYLKTLAAEKGIRELVIYFDEIEPTVLQALALTWIKGQFRVLLLKAPTLWKDWIYEDFARMTGATIIGTNGASWKTPSLTYLGTCEKLVAYRHGTYVIGTRDISDHIATIEEGGKKYPDLLARASWLRGKTATVKLGARSEVELSYRRLKLEDAANSAKMALHHGVVVGGGYALANAAQGLPDTIGGKILANALKAPLKHMERNANAPMPSEETLWNAGVWDAANIPKNAISAALSVAASVLNCDIAIPLDRTDTKYA